MTRTKQKGWNKTIRTQQHTKRREKTGEKQKAKQKTQSKKKNRDACLPSELRCL